MAVLTLQVHPVQCASDWPDLTTLLCTNIDWSRSMVHCFAYNLSDTAETGTICVWISHWLNNILIRNGYIDCDLSNGREKQNQQLPMSGTVECSYLIGILVDRMAANYHRWYTSPMTRSMTPGPMCRHLCVLFGQHARHLVSTDNHAKRAVRLWVERDPNWGKNERNFLFPFPWQREVRTVTQWSYAVLLSSGSIPYRKYVLPTNVPHKSFAMFLSLCTSDTHKPEIVIKMNERQIRCLMDYVEQWSTVDLFHSRLVP